MRAIRREFEKCVHTGSMCARPESKETNNLHLALVILDGHSDSERLGYRFRDCKSNRRAHRVSNLSQDLICGTLEYPIVWESLEQGAILNRQPEVSVFRWKHGCGGTAFLDPVWPYSQSFPHGLAGLAVKDARSFSRTGKTGSQGGYKAVETDVTQPKGRPSAKSAVSFR